MDFHSLARRELQDLCKKNKIPANMTNAAMADALNALEIVEGIEEYLKPIESETAQSSIESPMKSEAISPCGLRAAGRSTSRRNVVKEEPKTLQSRTATRRSTRKAVAAGDDGGKGVTIETPALAATTRRRAQVSKVRRKVETQFEEEETGKDKKTVPTPAPLGTTSQRKVKEEESAVKRVYSTRRSVRLAGKSAETLKANEGEKLETFKQELFTDDNLDMNMKQGSDASDKVLEINGVGTNTMSEDNSEETDNLDIVFEEEKKENFELEERLDESKILAGENIENQLDSSSEIQESDGSHSIGISEAENALDNGVESKDMEADNTVDDVIGNKDHEISCDANSPMETEKEIEYAEDMDSEVSPDIMVHENSCDVDVKKETQKEPQDDDMLKDVESGLTTLEESPRKVLGDDLEAVIEFIDHSTFPEQIDNEEEPDSIEILEREQREQDADQVSVATEESLGEVSSDDETEAHFDFIDQSTFSKQIGEKYDSVENLESEQSTFSKQIGEKYDSVENLESEQRKQEEVSLSLSTPIPTADPTKETQSYHGEPRGEISLSFARSDPEPVVQSTGFTPMKIPTKRTPSKTPKTFKKMPDISDDKENLASGNKILIFMEKVQTPIKTPTTNRKMTDVSDNKENLDSGKGITKEKAVKRAKGTTTEQNLHQFSLRKLTKMFKEKLQISNHSSQNENDPKAAKATSRPALHALPENQLVEELSPELNALSL